MSSAGWIEPSPAADLRLRLALLCDALDMLDQGAFLFAVCEEGPLRERLVRHVRDHVSEGRRDVIEAELSPDRPDLAGQLERRLLYDAPPEGGGTAPLTAHPVRERPHPPVIFVHTHRLADAGMPIAHLSHDHPEREPVGGRVVTGAFACRSIRFAQRRAHSRDRGRALARRSTPRLRPGYTWREACGSRARTSLPSTDYDVSRSCPWSGTTRRPGRSRACSGAARSASTCSSP